MFFLYYRHIYYFTARNNNQRTKIFQLRWKCFHRIRIIRLQKTKISFDIDRRYLVFPSWSQYRRKTFSFILFFIVILLRWVYEAQWFNIILFHFLLSKKAIETNSFIPLSVTSLVIIKSKWNWKESTHYRIVNLLIINVPSTTQIKSRRFGYFINKPTNHVYRKYYEFE